MKYLRHLNAATVSAFERYGHIFFFMPLVYDHAHELYGIIAGGFTAALVVAAAVSTISEA